MSKNNTIQSVKDTLRASNDGLLYVLKNFPEELSEVLKGDIARLVKETDELLNDK